MVIIMIFIFVIVVFMRCSHASGNNAVSINTEPKANDSLAFGDSKWISNGLKGKIYFLPENTSSLPNFDTMASMGTIYAHELNIPNRSWSTGFPGVPDRFEWFGIEYKGYFSVKKAGHYTFRLNSDDGAKLYIDDSLVVNNDGQHPVSSASWSFDLDGSEHSIRVQYFQGPRFYIALQLFAKLDKENQEEQVFPGNSFVLITPGASHTTLYIIIFLALVICVAFYKYRYYFVRK